MKIGKPEKSWFHSSKERFWINLEARMLSVPFKQLVIHAGIYIVVWFIVLKACFSSQFYTNDTKVHSVCNTTFYYSLGFFFPFYLSNFPLFMVAIFIVQSPYAPTRQGLCGIKMYIIFPILNILAIVASLGYNWGPIFDIWEHLQTTGYGFLANIYLVFLVVECFVSAYLVWTVSPKLCNCDICTNKGEKTTINYKGEKHSFYRGATVTRKQLFAKFPSLPKQVVFVCNDWNGAPLLELDSDDSKFFNKYDKLTLKTAADF